MQTSVIIPVWNGASVILDCLEALYAHSGANLREVICVDNASTDPSAALIAQRFPQARLLRQPVNLGFAGGVNAGLDEARGELLVLLNQDCVVQPGWLQALIQTFAERPEFGILGCMIFNADGSLNHTGAVIRQPEVIGEHLVDHGDARVVRRDYVTGAAFALRRETWQAVGRFDEGYYPGYFEESDYCYRARRKGIETACVMEARVTHHLSGDSWRLDLVRHTADQYRMRYRFICKHLDAEALGQFFHAEQVAIQNERFFAQCIGQVVAARDTLRALDDILARRRADLGDTVSSVHWRQLKVGFIQIMSQAYPQAIKVGHGQWRAIPSAVTGFLSELEASEPNRVSAQQCIAALRQREDDILKRLLFRAPVLDQPEPWLRRLWRLLVLRPVSAWLGRDGVLLAKLNRVSSERWDEMVGQPDQRIAMLEMLTLYGDD